ncbi:MAG: hypothetical protein V4574_03165 [Pseudomonadota bacterium]
MTVWGDDAMRGLVPVILLGLVGGATLAATNPAAPPPAATRPATTPIA